MRDGWYRLQWKNPVDGISGVHAIGYPSDEAAFAGAVEESYKLGWDGFTKPRHDQPSYRIQSRAEQEFETNTFLLMLLAIGLILAIANQL